ncbi:uncharacterized protein LOC119682157 [Teleopsis dalmanni]|uniref:uncharacterized protein LOC119682076 n=1 Tax=Teleopsis dalmanni TaxID=139649 RepID=UPI0018CF0D15|nr:uncharacterized protein LOC119682076 [Teleopsis dalmanni]XP_037951447.1 uncharacterized protein LOC119682157 [Teleopsis dalmanni]
MRSYAQDMKTVLELCKKARKIRKARDDKSYEFSIKAKAYLSKDDLSEEEQQQKKKKAKEKKQKKNEMLRTIKSMQTHLLSMEDRVQKIDKHVTVMEDNVKENEKKRAALKDIEENEREAKTLVVTPAPRKRDGIPKMRTEIRRFLNVHDSHFDCSLRPKKYNRRPSMVKVLSHSELFYRKQIRNFNMAYNKSEATLKIVERPWARYIPTAETKVIKDHIYDALFHKTA